jgi:hypothetical protein
MSYPTPTRFSFWEPLHTSYLPRVSFLFISLGVWRAQETPRSLVKRISQVTWAFRVGLCTSGPAICTALWLAVGLPGSGGSNKSSGSQSLHFTLEFGGQRTVERQT